MWRWSGCVQNRSERDKMRSSFWRRAMAAAAVLIGLGVGASTTATAATPKAAHAVAAHGTVHSTSLSDWWW
jgi:uncharacterized membrane protein YcjF (UPF0283 family)